MTIKFPVSQLPIYAKTRCAGFEQCVMECGEVVDGELRIESEKWQALTQYFMRPAKPFGLGDAVASVAQPIAGILDSVLGTNIKGCGGCAQRRDTLNRILPDISLR